MTDQRFSAEPYLNGLREFQRRTVDKVVDVFYRSRSGTRYLVADETGLGKSLIARGVIASAVEELQDDDSVGRIDVVYICSNADVARQNIKRLNVLGTPVEMSTRLSLLAVSSHQLKTPVTNVGKPVNLITLTPATSFPDRGWRTGSAEERALLFVILRDHMGLNMRRSEETAALRILKGGIATKERFQDRIAMFESRWRDGSDGGGYLAEVVVEKFRELARQHEHGQQSVLEAFTSLMDQTIGKRSIPGGDSAAANVVIGLRKTLARAGVEALEPDLIILDEFQRFTDLIGGDRPVSELAQELFGYEGARVLLLSATPYKPFDLDGTIDGNQSGSGSHRDQFEDTLRFLSGPATGSSSDDRVAEIARLLNEFRQSVTSEADPHEIRDELRERLLSIMCRTERPSNVTDSMVRKVHVPAAAVSIKDVEQFIKLTELARLVDSSLPMDVWKSVPELVHFMDAYQIGRRTRDHRGDPEIAAKLKDLQKLDLQALKRFEELPNVNPRLRALIDETTGHGWQELLWVPPSLPYFTPAGAYSTVDAQAMTKKLIFSEWSATPTAVASLLSYEARRRIARKAGLGHESTNWRLPLKRGDLSSMMNFIPFLPMPQIADQTDPLHAAKVTASPADPGSAVQIVAASLRAKLPKNAVESRSPEFADLVWRWPLALEGAGFKEFTGSSTGEFDAAKSMGADRRKGTSPGVDTVSDSDSASAISGYLEAAVEASSAVPLDLDQLPPALAERVANLAMHSPANCAWRSLGRLDVSTDAVSRAGKWRAAAVLASGLRTLFSRPETGMILDGLYPDSRPYWEKVLQYCADGNLQAMLDEYIFHLTAVEGDAIVDDESLIAVATEAAQAMRLREATYEGKDPMDGSSIPFPCRFALRYGDAKVEEGSLRSSEVREAFNSPFAPFVLVTTSVGQEGIDFHPWCHNLVHWNIPASPVDYEQREGRVNRFRGHAVRRNIAHTHGSTMLGAANPWLAAYSLAKADAPYQDALPGLAPDWVYPGPHQVIRELMPYQLSTDEARIDRVQKRVAYYRLAFGQARQEDLISVVSAAGVTDDEAERWRVDLAPG
ncbi:C-terminal helicase domain-containing protein [Gordonia sp. (in: high G+C Gram-positive bacteria)]|uniref:C-terminal helicase domain-containing protein n=1 Tax=Gordonia sp. (in: high G+C Gram-positive bacteria) TaxID=84139 RepID=UPI003C77D6C9